jgi:hypothetical protein
MGSLDESLGFLLITASRGRKTRVIVLNTAQGERVGSRWSG